MSIVVVNYGMGNLQSLTGALNHLGICHLISGLRNEISRADKLILPGVGSFSKAIENLERLDLFDLLKDCVLGERKPILGICLGMQLLFKSGLEGGEVEGLGFINGTVEKFSTEFGLKIPHVGFNEVQITNANSDLFRGVVSGSDFYFVHSYRILSFGLEWEAGITDYGCKFVSSVESGNIWGCQFHPEKSQKNGLRILKNFAEI